MEVPASVDRVEAEDIRFARPMINLSESLGRVPGISVQNRQNYAQDLQISSRGFGGRATFGIRGLRLITDGIPASFPDGQGQVSHFDLGSAQNIEVLRGPFAVMYGNASGGVINVQTERGVPGYAGDISFGSFGMSRIGLKAGFDGGLGRAFDCDAGCPEVGHARDGVEHQGCRCATARDVHAGGVGAVPDGFAHGGCQGQHALVRVL